MRHGRGWRATAALLATTVTALNASACYTYRPLVTASVEPGRHIAFELTDQGRVDVAEAMGSGVLRVEGLLQAIESQQYVVGVYRVALLNGSVSNWAGEKVRIPMGDVASTSARTFSRPKTYLAVAASVAAIAAFIVTRSLVGGGTPSGDPTSHGGTGSQ